jgi:predicted DNA-binding transcriptional regulator AlpA
MKEASDLELSRLVDIEVVKQWLSVKSVNAVKRRVASGEFPQPLRLSSKCVRWRVADLIDWSASAPAQAKDATNGAQLATCRSTISAPRRNRSK